jgi:hypothetical protein
VPRLTASPPLEALPPLLTMKISKTGQTRGEHDGRLQYRNVNGNRMAYVARVKAS